MNRLPPWIKIRLQADGQLARVHQAIKSSSLHTVCESAHCPNRSECFNRGTATVMILGDICTRNCRFCAVPSGTPGPLDREEPCRVAELAIKLRLKHVVVTSVTRDDIEDGGAGMFAETISRLKALPDISVEVLTPDFMGIREYISLVLAQEPDVFNHNLETVKRLQPVIRPQSDYQRSLSVLNAASESSSGTRVKSGIMVGLGETDEEIFEAMKDMLNAGCRFLTIGQYLAPSRDHIPVDRFVHPVTFQEYRDKALAMGFKAAASGPLVRSSYRAEDMLK